MSLRKHVEIDLDDDLAREMPTDPTEKAEVVRLGLREWRVRKALKAYREGHGTLAYAAESAGVPLRQMIPLAYAHGLTPEVDPVWLSEKLSLEEASRL